MVKGDKKGGKKDKKPKESTKDKAKVATCVAKQSLQDPELIKSLNLIDNQWQCTVVLVIPTNQKLYDALLSELSGQPDTSVITEQHLSQPRKESKDKKDPRSRSKSLGSAKSSNKTKKTTAKTNKTTKKPRSGSKSPKRSQIEEHPSTKTCFLLKKYIIEIKESDIKQHNKKSINELEGTKTENSNKQMNAHVESKIDEDCVAFHRFIILWGFYEPKILEELAKFMIPLRALIHVSEPDNPPTLPAERNSIKEDNKRKPLAAKKIKPVSDKLNSDYTNFVDEMSKNISNQDYLEVNKDVIFLNFTTSIDKNGSNFKANIKKLIQNIGDSWTTYEKYKQIIMTQKIPLIKDKLELETAELYNTLVSLVPLECINIPVIIHCMLEQVVWWVDDNARLDVSLFDSNHQTGKPGNTSQESIIRHLITKNITPVIACERDEIKLNTFHLHVPELNFEEISTKMFTRSPIYKLWEIYPAHIPSRSTWFKFHLQKLKDCNKKCYFNQNKLYLQHLHQLLMNTFVLNLNYISESQYNDDDSQLLEIPESYEFELSANKKPVNDKHSLIFVTLLINDLLDEIFQQKSMLTKSYSQIVSNRGLLSTHSAESVYRGQSTKPRWYQTKTVDIAPTGTSLEKKALYKEAKLKRLKSFLLCYDFVGLYEEISNLENEVTFYDCLRNYDYIEELDYNIMSQTLQSAFETFDNMNYEYFAPTDTLLLWFNDVSGNELTSSENVNVRLETPLGFRDFYTLKLKGKTNLNETSTLNCEEDMSEVLLEEFDYDSFDMRKDYNPLSATVYDLSSSRSEVSETVVHFDSPDSSKVLIKKISNFNKNKSYFNVSLRKNNITMNYEVDPDNDSKYVNINITFYNGIFANCSFTWKPSDKKHYMESASSSKIDASTLGKTEIQSEEDYELESNLGITLPSGLFIEIVPIDSELGPFYIKQRYLNKGPTCSNIWGESYRCYLRNGTIIIFHNDNSIEILNSNGAKVTCTAFEERQETIEIPEELVAKDDMLILGKNEGSSKKIKGGTKSKNDKNKIKKPSLNNDIKRKHVKRQSEKESIIKDNISLTEKVKRHKLLIKDHSVICPIGECITFKNNTLTNKETIHTLRMAFDDINQELYLQRSDKQSSLFTPEFLSVAFKDGSKITSYIEDNNELIIDDFTTINTLEHKPISYKSDRSLNQHKINIENLRPEQDQSENSSENTSIYDLDLENFVMVESSYDLEHNNYATVKFINNEDLTEISLPGQIKIRIDNKKLFTIVTENGDSICLAEDNSLHFQASVLEHSLKHSRSVIQFINFDNYPRIISQTLDSFDNKFSIDDRGNANLIRCATRCDKFESIRGPPKYPQNSHRFIVLQRDLTGYEIIHKNQTMSNYFVSHKTDKEILKIPLIKGNDDLFTLYTQKSIYKNKSEGYLMSYINGKNLPRMMKRKDLLKRESMPETIWFHRASTVLAPVPTASLLGAVNKPKAIAITQKTKIKISEYDIVSKFSTSLKKYMNMSRDIYKRYEEYDIRDNRIEAINAEGEQLKEKLFGSKSYHLVDNLPAVLVGDGSSQNHSPEITIKDILSSYEMLL